MLSSPVIFHIDVNSAFLSWKAVYQKREQGSMVDLREIPSAIGGDEESRHGIILAKSIPAKHYGVRTGESIAPGPAQMSLSCGCAAGFFSVCSLLRRFSGYSEGIRAEGRAIFN